MKQTTYLGICLATALHTINLQAAPLNNIVANWHIDEAKGQKVQDSSGYGKTGQLGSTSGLDGNDPRWVARRFDNAALHFESKHFVKVTNAKQLEPQKVSVEAWVKANATDATSLPYIVAKSQFNCHYAAYALYLHEDAKNPNGGVPYFYIANNEGTSYIESPEGAPNLWDGKWHHLVGTYDLKAVRLFVDGVQIGSGTPYTAPIGYNSFTNKDLYIGDYDGNSNTCNDYNGSFVGDIDEVRIWNKALSAAEVSSRYKGY